MQFSFPSGPSLVFLTLPLLVLACTNQPSDRKLVGGLLEKCPASPNCVQSEYSVDLDHYFQPISIPNKFILTAPSASDQSNKDKSPSNQGVSSPEVLNGADQEESLRLNPSPRLDTTQLMAHILHCVKTLHGHVQSQTTHYLHATFTSKIFGFVDDFELRIDPESQLLHLRSSSRTGYSDMGVNSERAQRFKEHFLEIY